MLAQDADELQSTIEEASALIRSSTDPPIRLLIVDSITDPLKDDLMHSTQQMERSQALYRVSRVLKRIAHKCAYRYICRMFACVLLME